MPVCLARAFATLKLFCLANNLRVDSIRNFTVLNMHAARNAHPWLGCKGADTITILKWLRFYTGLQREQPGWSSGDREILWWMLCGARGGLAFSQGIHGHGIWLAPSCVAHCRRSLQKFADSYAHLAHHCLQKNWSLFGMVPKIHAWVHFRTDMDDCMSDSRDQTLNPATFDCSMAEDFVGKISKHSRRIPFRHIERQLLQSYLVKTKTAINRFLKNHRVK